VKTGTDHVFRTGAWLAALAIALHAFWPLIANAKPKSVNLVPICTVEGITHYLELPGGNSPLDQSATAHHDHCAFCFLGVGGLLPSHTDFSFFPGAAAEPIASGSEGVSSRTALRLHGARAPPFLLSVIFDPPQLHRGNHETASAFGRHCNGAVVADPGARVLRLGVLHR
jgi:hypothetical protein